MMSTGQDQPVFVSRIPIEILVEVLSYLGPAPKDGSNIHDLIPDAESLVNCSIRSLSLVCRHFYHRLFPLRLGTVFVVNDRGDQSKYKLLHCRRFCRAIVDGNVRARALATYVRQFVIGRFDLTAAGRFLVEEELSVYSEALPFMSNLGELHLFQTSITNGLLNAILSLSPLKLLRLGDCNMPHYLDRTLLRQFAALRASHVSVWGQFSGNNEHATDQFLSSLCMSHTKTLTCKPSTSFRLLKGLASLGPMDHLTDIYIGHLYLDEHEQLLSDVLFATPALKRLHVAEITHWLPDDGIAFEPYTKFPKLQHLEYLHAHTAALEALIPGSRVSTVGLASEKMGRYPLIHISGFDFWHTLAAVVKKSNRPIEELNVPMVFYTNICFATHFSSLRRLTLRLQHPNWVYDSSLDLLQNCCDKTASIFLDSWPEYPDLTRLEFVLDGKWRRDLNSSYWALIHLKDVLPSLTSLVISDLTENKSETYTWIEDREVPATVVEGSS